MRASVARAIRMAQSWRAEVTVSNTSLFSGRNVLLSAQAVAPPPAAGRNLNIPYLAGVGAAAPRLCSPPPAAAAARISGLFPPLQRRACGLAPRSAHGESRGPVDPLVRRAYGRQEGLCLPALSRREPRSNAKVGMRVRH